ncbi:MAG: branched-chain amino acid aminotransferase [Bacteroidales bacterium]|nr:branched-chain amino acid aminotransferase [Bacteroidales bacterium]MDT8432267.1 branched-chain amino acid aminotransferase [Bacteroidales bacterium]
MNIDWKNLGFGISETDYNVRCYYRNGSWGELEISSSPQISMHMGATCLHYGQESFEGLKAYRGKDGRIRLFRYDENAKRMRTSAEGIMLAEVPQSLFQEAVEKVVKLNERFVPPHGTGASLYIRPLLIGTGPQVGVRPADVFLFMVFVMPVGPYFKEGFKPVDIMITRDHDRAAPLGTGHLKVGGNYAASMTSVAEAHDAGFATALYLDAREKKYIDEAGPANFFAIRDNTYITPDSSSILPSITNKSLQQIASDMGMKIEKRHIEVGELETFEETGACGTAAVITPIRKIVDKDTGKTYTYGDGSNPGPVTAKLYERLTGIQYGDVEDPYGWITILD